MSSIWAGAVLALIAIFAALNGFPYWYTFFLVGGILFFGGLNHRLHATSLYSELLEKRWKFFVCIYLSCVLFGGFLDILLGRFIADGWVYPHLYGVWSYFIPVLLYYPLGGVQLYEMFVFWRYMFRRFDKRAYTVKYMRTLAWVLISVFVLTHGAPVLTYILGMHRVSLHILTWGMILGIFSFDAIAYVFNGTSLLHEMLGGNKAVLFAFVLTWFLGVTLHELPNVIAQEWIYQNILYVQAELLGLNLLIATFGWFYLVLNIVGFVNVVRALVNKHVL